METADGGGNTSEGMEDEEDKGNQDQEEGVMTGKAIDCKTTLTDKMFEGETGK